MSVTYDIACHDCKQTLWIGQSLYIYKTKGHLKLLEEFLHQLHALQFGSDQTLDIDDYEELYAKYDDIYTTTNRETGIMDEMKVLHVNRETGECLCGCHFPPPVIMHIAPCCERRPNCQKRIVIGAMERHKTECELKAVK